MAKEKIFGTDGWRGRIADDYTFSGVKRCAQGFATYHLDQGHRGERVIVGYDKRFLSEYFAVTAAEVLAANGLRVMLTETATPTPAISYAVVANGAVGAINITASHNPPTDNGFKVRDQHGGAVAPDGLREIEARIPDRESQIQQLPLSEVLEDKRVVYFDPALTYAEQLQKLVDVESLREAGLKVLVDPMWGNGAGWFPRLLGGGKTQIIEIHNTRNPIFPEMTRPEPIQPNVDVGLRATVDHQADVLIATDGDADRVGLGDEHGQFIDQLRVFGLIAYHLLEVRGMRGPIVKTLSTTVMLDKLGKLYNVPVHHTGVGFKYVAPKMLETNAMVGGEESGGYAFAGHVPERDGILAGLFILEMMVKLNRTPSQLIEMLFDKVGPHYYHRIDKPFMGEREARIQRILAADPKTIGGLQMTGLMTEDGFKFNLEDGGWLLIRFSGTEPIIRVYTETTHKDRVDDILADGLRIAGLE